MLRRSAGVRATATASVWDNAAWRAKVATELALYANALITTRSLARVAVVALDTDNVLKFDAPEVRLTAEATEAANVFGVAKTRETTDPSVTARIKLTMRAKAGVAPEVYPNAINLDTSRANVAVAAFVTDSARDRDEARAKLAAEEIVAAAVRK